MKDYSTILCDCNNPEHLILLQYNNIDKQIYLNYHLCSLPF